MGCTSSKENTNPPSTTTTTTITNNNQQLINDEFRQWLKTNRPKADEYVLNDIILTTKSSTNINDYRPIVNKALDLLSERQDIKTINKLNKLVQKEVSLASPKKVSHTIDILKQTAEKLHKGQINFDNNQQQTTTTTTTNNGELPKIYDNKGISSGEPGIALKEALEKARILFYKGKQAAIFANPNGGYDVRIIDGDNDVLKQDGNLLRSIIVTEVKMRPKLVSNTSTKSSTSPPPPPPPPSSKLLDEHEIGDDFRRSIDAALKGLEAIYHKTSDISQTDIESKLVGTVNDINEEPIETTNGNTTILSSNVDHEHLSNQSIQEQNKLTNEIHSISNEEETIIDSINKIPPKPLRSIEEDNKIFSKSSSTPVTNTTSKSPSHNVTYTEIIHSESHDGEQSRHFITESYDELPTKDDEKTTSLKVVTKSEFSNDPTSGEKIMEQSVQIITVKVRNETVKTTHPSSTLDNDHSSEKQLIKTDVDTII